MFHIADIILALLINVPFRRCYVQRIPGLSSHSSHRKYFRFGVVYLLAPNFEVLIINKGRKSPNFLYKMKFLITQSLGK